MQPIKSTDNSINTYAYKNQNQTTKPEQHVTKSDDRQIVDKNNTAVNKTNDPAVIDNGIYSKKSAHAERLDRIKPDINLLLRKNAEQLIQMVQDILGAQGKHGFVAARKLENAILGLKDYLMNGGEITSEQQAAAAAAIADDGPWGIEAVSDRIVAMAVKFADGDESKYNMMKSAIEAGFKAAEAMWGGQLPEISYKTFDATMTKLAEAFGKNNQAEAS